jgi:hypothetical protein
MINKEQEKKIIKRVKDQRVLIVQLQEMGMNIQGEMRRHEGYLEALKDLLGKEKATELENKAVELVVKELKL